MLNCRLASLCARPVSYTHLDVYKRQVLRLAGNNAVAYGTALYKMPELTAERTYRLAEVSSNIIDQCVAQGVPFGREYGGHAEGNEVWNRVLDMDGNVIEETGNKGMVPFLFQGQYYDRDWQVFIPLIWRLLTERLPY